MSLENSLRFFETAHQNFLVSLSRAEEIKKFYKLAGFTICLKFSGSSLVNLLTFALAHLETPEPEKVDFVICLWEGSSLKLPWQDHSLAIRGNVVGYDNDQVHTVFDSHLQILQMFNKEKNLALYWIKDRSQAPWWIGASPLQFLISWWMQMRGIQLTHAGAVGYPEGGVLLAGKSGAGKSTTSLSCMRAGMKYVSEDYCLLSEAPEPQAHSVYNSLKVTEKTIGLFPELGAHIANPERPEGEKALVFHHQFQPQNILLSFPLKALVTLEIWDDNDSKLQPIHPKEALPALAATTLWQLVHAGPSTFKHLRRVAEALPCYRLYLGRDFIQIPKLIETLL